jgi:hypothetical protein
MRHAHTTAIHVLPIRVTLSERPAASLPPPGRRRECGNDIRFHALVDLVEHDAIGLALLDRHVELVAARLLRHRLAGIVAGEREEALEPVGLDLELGDDDEGALAGAGRGHDRCFSLLRRLLL